MCRQVGVKALNCLVNPSLRPALFAPRLLRAIAFFDLEDTHHFYFSVAVAASSSFLGQVAPRHS